MADKPFTIIGVNSDQEIGRKTLEQIREISKKKSLTWRSFQNTGPEEKISTTWNVSGWPTTYLIDAEGKIRYKNLRGEKLDEALEKLMDEMGHKVSLVGVDHEAEDEAAMEAEKERAMEAEKERAAKAEQAKKEAEESGEASSEEESDDSEKAAEEKPASKDEAKKEEGK